MESSPLNRRIIEDLVRDTLYCRRMDMHGCFEENLAAADLDALDAPGPTILSVIESVVFAEVEGRCTVCEDARNDDFPGLLTVLRTYFDISDRSDLESNAAKFLCRISHGTRLFALDAIHRLIYWQKPLPKELRRVLQDLLQTATPPECAAIKAILERHPIRRWWFPKGA